MCVCVCVLTAFKFVLITGELHIVAARRALAAREIFNLFLSARARKMR